jgi:hypothetical protein
MKALAKTFAATCLLALAIVSPAQAAFGVNNFDVRFEEEDGSLATKAGSHPFAITTIFGVNFHEEGGEAVPEGDLRNLEVDLPVGFAGNPTAMPTCTRTQFREIEPGTGASACPNDTAVGRVVAEVVSPGGVIFPGGGANAPVFNLQRPKGVAAELGFVVARELVTIDVVVKKGHPYNVSAAIVNTPQVVKFFGSKLTIWGNPASPVHDSERGLCLFLGGSCPVGPDVEEKPFLTLPRACAPPLVPTYRATSWQEPLAPPDEGASETALELSGCEELEFGGDVEAQPTATATEAPSGLDFELHVDDPGLTEPEGTANADIEKITTILPEGVTANPSAASGLAACSFAQFEAEDIGNQSCPEASKLGTVQVESPLLEEETLGGQVYLASQSDNPFGTLLALYIVIKDPKLGIVVKQAGRVDLDPTTGRVTTTVEDMPQLPLSDIRLHLRAGPRAPLVLPEKCGTYTTAATLTPYNGDPPITSTSSFDIGSGVGGGPCPAGASPFAPAFTAGTAGNKATSFSPFNMRFTRKDGEQEMTRLSATLPRGLVPKLAGVTKCPDAAVAIAKAKSGRSELASPSCPANSLIGHVSAGAGVGSELTYVGGSVHLAGPFGGDPLSAIAIVPAVAGPLDVGTVVTRVGLTLNPETYLGEIDGSAAEPFPRILAGVPLRLRDLRISADRPQFTLNASGCEAEQTGAQLTGVPTVATLAARYQATGCGDLGFNPKLSLALLGKTKRSGHPRLRSSVTYPYPSGPGYSNIGRAVVTLPRGEQIDNAHINNPCTRVQFNADQCPPGSVLGTAKATSPLLDKPLEGPVIFRSNGGERLLPDIVADLHGEVDIVLIGAVISKKSRLTTTFANVPDAPVTRFDLNLYGGKRGLLVNNRDICKSAQKAGVVFTGQNNRLRESQIKVKTSCKKGKGGKNN